MLCAHACRRMLDDPTRGTVVDGMHEEPVQSAEHLASLLALLEPRRQARSAKCRTFPLPPAARTCCRTLALSMLAPVLLPSIAAVLG